MKTRDMVHVALFAALVAALGVLPPLMLPFIPVPITAQTLGVMLAGSLLGARKGGLALLLVLVLVAAGMPILAGGNGGLGVFPGPTGGFLSSWPLAALVIGWCVERSWERLGFWGLFLFNVLGGIGVVYLVGIPWLAAAAGLPLQKAALGSALFLPGDLAKAAIAASVTLTLRRAYPLLPVAASLPLPLGEGRGEGAVAKPEDPE